MDDTNPVEPTTQQNVTPPGTNPPEATPPGATPPESAPVGEHDWFAVESEADAPTGGSSTKSWVMAGVGAIVIAGAAIFGINAATSSPTVKSAVAGASTNGPGNGPGNGQANAPGGFGQGGFGNGRRGTIGTVDAIDGTSFTVTALAGPPDQSGSTSGSAASSTIKVTTNDATTITKAVTGTLADVKVGDRIRATGTGSASDLTATSVNDQGLVSATANGRQGTRGQGAGGGFPGADNGGSGAAARMFVSGTVAAVDGTKITVTTNDGTATVTTAADTTFTTTDTVKVSDLAKGDTVVVQGETTGATVAATSIRVGEFGGGFGGRGFGGGAPGSGAPGAGTSN